MTHDAEFDAWFAQVNRLHRQATIGFTAEDLPDQPYRDWYDDEVTPAEAVEMLLENEGLE